MMQNYTNSIFWVETDKIKPNPYQPRREFDERALVDLADSIRQYGVLQPLVVTRNEIEKPDGLAVEYELIAGERRLRASRIAGLPQVPVIIRSGAEDAKVKLELAIIENLQREDLNPIDRAWAFMRLHSEFGFTHAEIGKKMGKSREYVSNSLRLLALPQDIMTALAERKISEGHTRPLMMLSDRPDEQTTLFKEIVIKKLSVREAEALGAWYCKR
jgi:ParB family chromosome partitioning protein